MKRLARILLNAATVVSLVMCAATVFLWVRSYRGQLNQADRVDSLSWCYGTTVIEAAAGRGSVSLLRVSGFTLSGPFETQPNGFAPTYTTYSMPPAAEPGSRGWLLAKIRACAEINPGSPSRSFPAGT